MGITGIVKPLNDKLRNRLRVLLYQRPDGQVGIARGEYAVNVEIKKLVYLSDRRVTSGLNRLLAVGR